MFEQDRMLMRLQQRVLADSAIRVCFLSGSHGRREADDYSDLDVALVYATAERRDAAWQKRRDFVKDVYPYVAAKSYDAEEKRPYLHSALYSNGALLEFRYEAQSELQPRPGDREIRLLKDDGGWGETYQAACRRLPYPAPALTAETLARLDDRFWVAFWDVFRQLMRGDHQKPFLDYLDVLHATLPPILAALPAEHPAHLALTQTRYSADAEATLAHLAHLLEAYREARTAVVQRLHLDFTADAAFERDIQNLVTRYGR